MKTVLCVLALAAALAPAAASAAVVRAPDIEQRVSWGVPVYCVTAPDWPRPDADGLSDIPNRRVFLRGDVCDALRVPAVTLAFANAVQTLLHELSHVSWQNANENAAECFSLFVYRAVLRHSFGADGATAKTLYDMTWHDHLAKPPDYQGCTYLKRDPVG